MGERAGYRVREGDKVSDLIRKQWKIDDIEGLVTDVAKTLLSGYVDDNIGSGGVALRDDLHLGRLTAALYYVVYEPPFDSIETDPVACDISDHGLYEIELVAWNHWKIWNYAVGWRDDDPDLFDGMLIAEVTFTEGKSLSDGMNFKMVKANLAETIDRMLSELSEEIGRLRSIRYHVQDLNKGEMLLSYIEELDVCMMKTHRYGETVLEEYGKL